MKAIKSMTYAMTCLKELANQFGDFVQVSDIARKHDLPEAYCQKILLKLSRSGLVESVRGQGFTLCRPVSDLTPETVRRAWSRGIMSILLAVFSAAAFSNSAQASIGLSTRFVDVTLEYLEVGRAYNLRTLRNIPYTVKNRGDADASVKVEVGIPKKEEVTEGYEAIPDPNWVRILPNTFKVPAGQTAYAEIIIQVPNKPEFVGKHYQAKIYAHTTDTGMYGVGTQSRLRFSTGAGPETLKEEAKEKAMMTMDFDVTPQEIYAGEIEPGKKINLNAIIQRKLKVTNRAETPIDMKFKSIPWVSTLILPDGYVAAPDPEWIRFSPEEAVIKGDRIVTVDPLLKIPAGDEHRGKKYAFLMKADLVMGVDLEIYCKIFVTVKNK